MSRKKLTPEQQKHLLEKVMADPVGFICRLKIINKKGRLAYLTPTEEQLTILDMLCREEDALILKPRQIGSTTIVAAYLFYRWYTSQDSTTTVILSHKISSAKHILAMHKIFYNSLPAMMRRELIIENTTEMVFADTGAKLMAASAEGKGGLRSFTCNYLHISEYAFAPNPEELKATALGALNGNQLIIESTANHYGDALHQEIIRAKRGEGGWNFAFFPWFDHDDYADDYPIGWEAEDIDYQVQYRLSTAQMHWRAIMMHRLGAEKFKREYPATVDEAFAQSGNAYFTDDDLRYVEVHQIEASNNAVHILTETDKTSSYGIGVDVASGRGGDFSVIIVVDKRSYQPVCIYRSNTISPVALAEKIIHIATMYNQAKVLVEENNWGLPVLNELRHRGYFNLWKSDKDKNWITTTKSKITMFEELKALLAEGVVVVLDSVTYVETRSFQVDERGLAPKVPDNLEHHGDCVIALGLAYQCLKTVRMDTKTFLPDWIKERRAQEIIDNSLGQKEKRY